VEQAGLDLWTVQRLELGSGGDAVVGLRARPSGARSGGVVRDSHPRGVRQPDGTTETARPATPACERQKGDADRSRGGGGEREVSGVERGGDERHARKRALREETTGAVDDEKAAVPDEAERVELGGEDGDAGEGFDGVEEEAGEAHGMRGEGEGLGLGAGRARGRGLGEGGSETPPYFSRR